MAPKISDTNGKPGLERLQYFLGLCGNCPRQDVIFLSLNVKGYTHIHRGLDWPHLKDFGVFLVGTRDNYLEKPKFYRDEWGRPARIDPMVSGRHSLSSRDLRRFYVDEDRNEYTSQYRKFVLVGHDMQAQLKLLEAMDIRLQEVHTIVAFLDTQEIAQHVLGTKMDLEALPFTHLGNAGNDAYFTLRALLLLANHSYTSSLTGSEVLTPERSKSLWWLRTLALGPLPPVQEDERNPVIVGSVAHAAAQALLSENSLSG